MLVRWATARSSCGGVRRVTVVVVVRTNLLHQFIVYTVEAYIDADDFEGFRAQPGHVALHLLLVAHLGRVVATQGRLLVAVRFLILYATVERFGVFGLQRGLLGDLKLHHLGGRHQADRHVPQTRGVVAKVNAERAVPVVHDLPRDQHVEFYSLDVGVEVSPPEHFFELASLDDGPAFSSGLCNLNICLVR